MKFLIVVVVVLEFHMYHISETATVVCPCVTFVLKLPMCVLKRGMCSKWIEYCIFK